MISKTIEATDANFTNLINSDKPVLVDFSAEWCGPCRLVSPLVDQLAHEYADQAVVAKMDIDQNAHTPSLYKIRSAPTLLFFKNGQLIDKVVGAVPKAVLEQKLQSALAV
ncbi:thioredoxin [Nibrella saemangeumensis]|uniref:Thioredoxin n=1 Tax=Nibrella saemangeumensis TaxID=1084526 RepID=A0ABP8MR92_9BACT